jgi:hypothetical protein
MRIKWPARWASGPSRCKADGDDWSVKENGRRRRGRYLQAAVLAKGQHGHDTAPDSDCKEIPLTLAT